MYPLRIWAEGQIDRVHNDEIALVRFQQMESDKIYEIELNRQEYRKRLKTVESKQIIYQDSETNQTFMFDITLSWYKLKKCGIDYFIEYVIIFISKRFIFQFK